MKYLIDTNVISEVLRKKPNEKVIQWLESVPSESLYISVLTLGEIRKGVEKLPASKRKTQLVSWLEHEVPQWFESRILAVSKEVADKWGYLNGESKNPLPAIDSLLAATAQTHNLKMVTRNTKEFNIPGLETINPFK